MLPALALIAVLSLLTVGYRSARRRGIAVFHLGQFHPSAPLAGRLPVDRDAARALLDLKAVESYRAEQTLN